MSYQNTVIVGNIGGDAELRYTQSGQTVANVSVAVNRRWTGNDGQSHEETTWFRVALWGKFAESLAPYLTKGKLVLVEGRVQAKAFIGKDGEAKASLELTAANVRLLGGNGGRNEDVPAGDAGLTEDEIPF